MQKYICKIIIIFLSCLFISDLDAQEAINDKVKCHYILSFGKFLEWNDQESLDQFTIGTFGKDTSFYARLQNMTKKRKIRKKPVVIKHFTRIKDVKNVQILYIERGRCNDIKKIYKHISGKNILLVTDSCEGSRETMLNFLPLIYVRLEINQSNMEKEGFEVPSFLAAFAAKYKQDYQELLSMTEDSLKKEKEVVTRQKETLEKQMKEIKEKELRIGKLNDTLKYQLTLVKEKEKELNAFADLIKKQDKRYKLKIQLIKIQEEKIGVQLDFIKKSEKQIEKHKKELEKQQNKLVKQKREITEQEEKITSQNKQISSAFEQIKKQRLIRYFITSVSLLLGIFLIFIYYHYRNKKKANNILSTKNTQITQQKEEIEAQRDEIESQRDLVTQQKEEIETIHTEMKDSIEYAQRIQTAILPPIKRINDVFKESFIFFEPKDIVSGDFYWFATVEENTVIAAADCTGHGVPGAFMSMLGISLLRDIVVKEYITHTGVILKKLRKDIIRQLNQSDEQNNKDGMDISLCSYNKQDNTLQFSGANNPIYIVRTNNKQEIPHHRNLKNDQYTLYEIKGDNMPVSIHEIMNNFNDQIIQLLPGDTVYQFSDGFADQFGGPKLKKFKYKPFKETLLKIQDKNLSEQKEYLIKCYHDWKGNLEQVDDILIIAYKI